MPLAVGKYCFCRQMVCLDLLQGDFLYDDQNRHLKQFRSTLIPDLEVWGSSLAQRVVPFSLDKELYSTLSLFTQVYKWVPVTYCCEVTLPCTSIPLGVGGGGSKKILRKLVYTRAVWTFGSCVPSPLHVPFFKQVLQDYGVQTFSSASAIG